MLVGFLQTIWRKLPAVEYKGVLPLPVFPYHPSLAGLVRVERKLAPDPVSVVIVKTCKWMVPILLEFVQCLKYHFGRKLNGTHSAVTPSSTLSIPFELWYLSRIVLACSQSDRHRLTHVPWVLFSLLQVNLLSAWMYL